jgi:hypothetical protein
MRKGSWDGLLTALVLIRFGQELGTESPLAKAVFLLAEMAGKLAVFFPVDKF